MSLAEKRKKSSVQKNVSAIYALSALQEGMLFESLRNQDSGVYITQMVLTLPATVNAEALELAWNDVIQHFPIFRTAFALGNKAKPLQAVLKTVDFTLDIEDWRDTDTQEKAYRLTNLVNERKHKGFDFTKAPLMSAVLVHYSHEESKLLWTHHHALIDGWSLPQVFDGLSRAYHARVSGKRPNLPYSAPYEHYVRWLSKQDESQAQAFWTEYLAGFTEKTPLPMNRSKGVTGGASKVYGTLDKVLEPALCQQLEERARHLRVTLNTLVQAAWGLLLSRCSYQNEVLFGAVSAGRPANLKHAETIVGAMIATVPVRMHINGDTKVSDFLTQVQQAAVKARDFEFSSLSDIQRWSELSAGDSLFDTLLAFENYPYEENSEDANAQQEFIREIEGFEQPHSPLTLAFIPGKQLTARLFYDCHHYDHDTVERLLDMLCEALRELSANADRCLYDLDLFTQGERVKVVEHWNNTATNYADFGQPDVINTVELFEAQVSKTPQACALIFNGEQLTYAELNNRANALAITLRELGVGAAHHERSNTELNNAEVNNAVVGIMTERSFDMMVGIIAVMKSGGAYLPLLCDTPNDRLSYIAEKSGMVCLVSTQESHAIAGIKRVAIPETSPENDLANLPHTTTANHLAYVLYTSGSTGVPKGVMVPHSTVINFLHYMQQYYPHTHSDTYLLKTAYTFDGSVSELMGWWLGGGRLAILPQGDEANPDNIIDVIHRNTVSHVNFAPTMLSAFVGLTSADDIQKIQSLKFTMVGGEAFSPSLVEQLKRQQYPGDIINLYGPTETTVYASNYPIDFEHFDGSVPIGNAMPNVQLYVMDDAFMPLGVGMVGELCIGGAGVSWGYLGQANLTADRFVPDPYGKRGERLYRTGDLVRWRADAKIEYIGRSDFQVKIRGFRIELGEVENVLATTEGVKEAIALVRDDHAGAKRLIAYVVGEVTESALRHRLESKLLSYMVPSAFVILDRFPVTSNGKADRRALPMPSFNASAYEAPRTATELALSAIWVEALGLESISREDNFFELGGHSLLALKIIGRIRTDLNIDLPVNEFFEHGSIASLATFIDSQATTDASDLTEITVTAPDYSALLPLSFSQQRLYFLDKFHPKSGFYNVSAAFEINGLLDVEVLKASFDFLGARHEAFRTQFFLDDHGQPRQKISEQPHFTFMDKGTLAQAEIEQAFTECSAQGFDLSRDALTRVMLAKVEDEQGIEDANFARYRLLLSMHHIICDGQSIGTIYEELSYVYGCFAAGVTPELTPIVVKGSDYAVFQRNEDNNFVGKQLDYWADALADVPQLLSLPVDKVRPPAQSFQGGRLFKTLPAGFNQKIRACATKFAVTPSMFILTAYKLLLHRLSGQNTIVVGVPSANRSRPELEKLIGFFVNSLAIRVDFDEGTTVENAVSQVKTRMLDGLRHQDIPFEQLVEALSFDRDPSYSPVFQVMYTYEASLQGNLSFSGLKATPLTLANPFSKFDLTLNVFDSETLTLALEYNADLFLPSTVERFIEGIADTLEALTQAEKTSRLDMLPTMPDSEKLKVLTTWNESPIPPDSAEELTAANVVQLFESQVAKRPDAAALRVAGDVLSYAQLNQRANHIAHRLIAQGVTPGMTVGLLVERSFELIAGMLGIIKAGGVFCPLDLDYPAERLAYILNDSGLQHCLVSDASDAIATHSHINFLRIDQHEDKGDTSLTPEMALNPELSLVSESALYVMYTSGSTGNPKGVVNTHAGVMRLVRGSDFININADDVFLQLSTPSFDASSLEIWGALLNGAELVLAPQQKVDVEQLGQLLQQHNVTTLWLTAAFLNVVVKEDVSILKGLRTLLAGGDVLSTTAIEQVLALFGTSAQVINGYGPTENTTFTCCHQITPADVNEQRSIPIGKPIAQTQVYVLNQALQPLGIGMLGELYASGEGLAQGYLGAPALSAERFIPNPFGPAGSRLYRTGDLVRWRADGTLEFVGRADFQVKIRGYRIELGEIEAALVRIEGVKEAIVLAREDEQGAKRLVAYIVGDVQEETVRHVLSTRVPEYMLPSAFVLLPAFPLTSNGKVNRRALPAPEHKAQDDYVAPQTEVQKALCALWQDVLNVERVGLNDNFFDLGGDSILSIQIASRANKAGYRVSVKDIFSYPTVGELAPHSQAALTIDAEQGTVEGELPLLPIQQWFFEQALVAPNYWNQSFFFKVPSNFTAELAHDCLQQIVTQHDALRLRFNAGKAQFIPASPVDVTAHNLSESADVAADIERLSVAAKSSLSISEGPLFKAVVFTLADGEQRLLLTLHHLVIDTVSWRVLIEDLITLYNQAQAKQQPLTLGDKTSSYRQWAEFLREYATSDALALEIPYWQQTVTNGEALAQTFPVRNNPPAATDEQARGSVSLALTCEETRALLEDVHEAYNTQVNDVLLAALMSAYHAFSHRDHLRIHLEGHGREALNEQLDLGRTVGWFTTLFPVTLSTGTQTSRVTDTITDAETDALAATLIAVKEQLHGIPNKGIGYGVLRYCHPDDALRTQLQDPHTSVSFNYLGQFDQAVSDGPLQFAPEYSGADMLPNENHAHSVDIISMVAQGSLRFNLHFNSGLHAPETMQAFAALYMQHLRDIIAHCCTDGVGEKTAADFALAAIDQQGLQRLCTQFAVDNSRDFDSIYPLSPLQEGMLFESLRHEGHGVYITQLLLTLPGDVDRASLQAAWNDVVNAFPILRTGFKLGEGAESVQAVMKHVSFPVELLDWRAANAAEKAERFETLLATQKQQGFDYMQAPLMSAVHILWSDTESKLLWAHHHALIDGWSLPQVFTTLSQSYQAHAQGQTPELPYSAPYEHYIRWLVQQDNSAAQGFWTEYLAGISEKTALPLSRPKSEVHAAGSHYSTHTKALSPTLCAQLEAQARQCRVTLNTFVQAAWGLLLSRSVHSDEVIFGAVSAGRPANLAHAETIVGAMIATVPVRMRLSAQTKISEFLAQVQEAAVKARSFEYAPLASIQSWSELPAGENLFDTVLAFENYPYEESEESGKNSDEESQHAENQAFIRHIEGFEQPHSPLTLAFVPGKQLTARVFYDCSHYDSATIEYLLELLSQSLAALSENTDRRLYDIDLLSNNDRQQVVEQWNNTTVAFDAVNATNGATNIAALFEAQAKATPEATALLFNDKTLTYAELNQRANALAITLREQGVTTNTVVGLWVDRSFEMLVGLIGILKAGGAYLPLATTTPEDRLAYIAEQSAMTFMVSANEQHTLAAIAPALTTVAIPTTTPEAPLDNLPLINRASDLAYVLYTSGSTGLPKGVMVPHSSALNFLQYMQHCYAHHACDTYLLKTAFTFDVSLSELLGWCIGGGRLAILPQGEEANPDAIIALIHSQQVTHVNFAPSMLNAFLGLCGVEEIAKLSSLKYTMVAGEAFSSSLVEQLKHQRIPGEIINLYGPTEATVYASQYLVNVATHQGSVPIGTPVPNAQLYVMDATLKPLGVGMVGELCIGGAGVAWGYLGQAALTAEHFVPDPFSNNGARLYRTGDLVRWRADGNIEYIGRSDFQVKIRGFRIELGEVENVLAQCDGVKEVIALVCDEQDPRDGQTGVKRLVAYVAGNAQETELRERIASQLPSYMMPSAFVLLPSFPVTSSGKVDRRALPVPAFTTRQTYVAPRTPAEKALCDIWQDVLKVDSVGIHDNFFDLGGDSILSIQIASRANQAGLHIRVKDIFNYLTVDTLAPHCQAESTVLAIQEAISGEHCLAPVQHWFFEQAFNQPDHWNQSFLFTVPPSLTAERISVYLTLIEQHHDALRLRFTHGNAWYQAINDEKPSQDRVLAHDLRGKTDEACLTAIEQHSAHAKQSLSLANGPVFKAVLFQLDHGQQRLMLTFHHLVIDTVSWRILIEDMTSLHQQDLNGEQLSLGKKSSAYVQWTQHLREYATSEALAGEVAYWQTMAEHDTAPFPTQTLAAPDQTAIDKPRASVSARLTAEETKTLLENSHDAYNTQINDLLLAALASAYQEWSGHSALRINMEGHGREELFEQLDISRTVGWFTSIFPVTLRACDQLASTLMAVKEDLRAMPNKGIGYSVLRYLHADVTVRETLASAAANVSFNYLGQFDQATSEGPLQFAAEASGAEAALNEKFAHHLDIVSMVSQGELALYFQYDPTLHDASAMQAFLASYVAQLRDVIAHCSDGKNGARTPSDFALATLNQPQLDAICRKLAINSRDIQGIYPLSPLQEGMLFESERNLGSGVYVTQMVISVPADVNVNCLVQAWNDVIAAYPILRTAFDFGESQQSLQVVADHIDFALESNDWREQSNAEKTQRLTTQMQQRKKQGFAASHAPLMAVELIHWSDTEIKLVWTHHHALVDGWSLPILLGGLSTAYKHRVQGQTPTLAYSAPYEDYIRWLTKQDKHAAQAFWSAYLADVHEKTPLPLAKNRGKALAAENRYEEYTYALSPTLNGQLEACARQHRVTLNTLMQAAWALVLSRCVNANDIVFGAVSAGRPADLRHADTIVGAMITTVPMRVQVSPLDRVSDLLAQIQDASVQVREFEYAPLASIQQWSDFDPGDSLFDTILAFESYPYEEGESDLTALIQGIDTYERPHCPLSVAVIPGAGLTLRIYYDAQYYDAATVERLYVLLENTLSALTTAPDTRLFELNILPDAELHQVVEQWSHAPKGHEVSVTDGINVIDLFEAQVRQTPDALAVRCSETALTYAQFNAQANQLAWTLIEAGVRPTHTVGLHIERSSAFLVGIVAVLKTGAAYLPVNLSAPAERMQYMFTDAAVNTVVVRGESAKLDELPLQKVDITQALATQQNTANPVVMVPQGGAAYTIYTSGSTGQPKGVLISHRALLSLVTWTCQRYDIAPQHRSMQNMGTGFDPVAFEIWPYLTAGASVHVVPEDVKMDSVRLQQWMVSEAINFCIITTAIAESLLTLTWPTDHQLIRLFTGGEKLLGFAPEPLAGQLSNCYGPTETTIVISTGLVPTAEQAEQQGLLAPTIGIPMGNAQIYVLDELFMPLGVGMIGELFIGGDAVGIGYLDQSALTAERFIPNPFGAPGSRLYRSGDLVHWRSDGSLEFMGRRDFQIKIRGQRIELGEVESFVMQAEGVKEVVVLAREDEPGIKRLVAYVVGDVDIETLQHFMRARVPEVMVPSAFVIMEQFPQTANNKVDHKALPVPVLEAANSYQAPQNAVEIALCQIWEDILKVERIGIKDNFFDMGGDSILSMQIASRANALGYHVRVQDLFTYPSIEQLAPHCEAAKAIQAEQNLVSGEQILLPIQRWFFEHSLYSPAYWNQSFLLRVPNDLTAQQLDAYLQVLQQQHDVLRLQFGATGSQNAPSYASNYAPSYAAMSENSALRVIHHDLRELDATTSVQQLTTLSIAAKSSLSLAQAPLCKAVLFSLPNNEQRLLLTMHHLIVDTVSWRVVIDDLSRLHQQAAKKQPLSLGAKTTSYREWAIELERYAVSDTLAAEIPYWQSVVAEDLPAVFERNTTNAAQRQGVSASLDAAETTVLLAQIHDAYNTQVNDILLTAFLVAYQQTFGLNALRLHMEAHGRETISDTNGLGKTIDLERTIDLGRTVGWFTTIFPVVLRTESDLAQTLIAVKESLRGIPNKGIGYGVLRYLHEDESVRQHLANSNADISFNYLGQFDQATDDGAFQFAPEFTGPDSSLTEKSLHALDVVSLVKEGVLTVSLQYEDSETNAQNIPSLLNHFMAALRELLTHCQQPNIGARTPSDFSQLPLNNHDLQRICHALNCHSRELEALYPLSPLQEGMLFESLRHTGSGVYVTQVIFTLPRQVNTAALHGAWMDVMQAFPILRTAFMLGDGEQSVQAVLKNVALDIAQHDWSTVADSEKSDRLAARLNAIKTAGFKATQAPLMGVEFIQWSATTSKMIWAHHHALVDGWSLPHILSALSVAYQARSNGVPAQLPYSVPYEQYIQWLTQQDQAAAEAFWREYLAELTEKTPLPLAVTNTTIAKNTQFEVFDGAVKDEVCAQLDSCSRQQRITLNSLVQTAWGIVLGRCSNSDQVLFGTVSAGRPADLAQADTIVGAMIATVPVRIDLNPSTALTELLSRVQSNAVQARNYEYASLSSIQRWSALPAGQAIFDSVLAFENFPFAESAAAQESFIQGLEGAEQPSGPLTLAIIPGKQLIVRIFYDRHFYTHAQVERLFNYLSATLAELANHTNKRLGELRFLSSDETQQVLQQWSQPCAPSANNGTALANIGALFEAQVAQHPNATALIFGEQSVSYHALDTRANQLAARLRELGVGPGSVVGVMIPRSIDMMLGLLAIVKAGASYCPLDSDYPEDRLSYIIQDSGLSLVLIAQEFGFLANFPSVNTLRIDDESAFVTVDNIADQHPSDWRNASPQTSAYIMYTSGSTGQPKGVMATHEAVIRLVHHSDYITIDSSDVFLQLSTPSFDAATLEIWGALLNGATLVLAPAQKTSVEALAQLLQTHQVTTLWLTSALLNLVVKENVAALSQVRQLLAGGDKLTVGSVAQALDAMQQVNPNATFINGYGPTENTTFTCCHIVSQNDISHSDNIPIGRPINGTEVYVLDEQLQPLGVGMVGELYTGGAGLAWGYLGRSAMTAERFIPNPFGKPGSRLYRTGDLVRWNNQGCIEFVGRNDFQVKIRGYRIELGEIEAAIAALTNVHDTVVLAREDQPNVKRLVAYVVGETNEATLRDKLRSQLPDYLMPAVFMVMDAFPLTQNGKVDRRALPIPQASTTHAYQAPTNAVELLLCNIWAEVLNAERIGINDNFFELGGDSILSMQIVSRTKAAGYQLSVNDLFNHPTIAELAPICGEGVVIEAEQSAISGEQTLLPIQQWFFEQGFKNPDYWNQSFLFQVPAELTANQLAEYLYVVETQHDALRLRFSANTAFYTEPSKVNVAHHDLTHIPVFAERLQALESYSIAAKAALCVEQAPIFKAVLFTLGEGEKRLLLTVHHLVIDTVSWRVIIEDLTRLHTLAAQHKPLRLPNKTSALQLWGTKLAQYAQSEALHSELPYWQSVVQSTMPALLTTPTEPAENTEASSDRGVISVALEPEQTDTLLALVGAVEGAQVQHLLLAAVLSAYQQCFGQTAMRINLEGHGREELFEEVDLGRTVGWFTTIFPVNFSAEKDLKETLLGVKEAMQAIPNKGVGYGVLRYLHNDKNVRQALSQYQSDVSFNYLGQFDQATGSGPFQFASESSGPEYDTNEKRVHSLDIVSMIVGGTLSLTFQFNVQRHQTSAMQQWLNSAFAQLHELLRQCATNNNAVAENKAPTNNLLHDVYLNTRWSATSLPFTYTQLDFWLIYMSENDPWLIHGHRDLQGNIHTAQLEKAVNHVVSRHQSLWVRVSRLAPMQHISEPQPIELPVIDLQHLSEADVQAEIQRTLAQGAATLLKTAHAFRFYLFKLSDSHSIFTGSFSHISVDRRSIETLFAEIGAVYSSLHNDTPITLPKAALLESSVNEERRRMTQQTVNAQEQQWHQQLADAKDYLLPEKWAGESAPNAIKVSQQDFQQLLTLAAAEKATPQMLLLALISKAMAAFTGQHDFCIKLIFDDRNQAPSETLIAPSIREMLAKISLRENDSLSDSLADIKRTVFDLISQRDYPWIIPLAIFEKRHTPTWLRPVAKAVGWFAQSLFSTVFRKAKVVPGLLNHYSAFSTDLFGISRRDKATSIDQNGKTLSGKPTEIVFNYLVPAVMNNSADTWGDLTVSAPEAETEGGTGQEGYWANRSLEFNVLPDSDGGIIVSVGGGKVNREGLAAIEREFFALMSASLFGCSTKK